ncbi:hypothetical protein ACSSS7_003259 [Eimeria intestinalis]
MVSLQGGKRLRGSDPDGRCSDIDTAGVEDKQTGSGRLLNPLSPNPSPHFNAALQQCVYPHILSYNTFADCYIEEMVKELPFIYIDPRYEADQHELNPYYKPTDYLKIGISDAVLGVPQKIGTSGAQAKAENSNRLLPRHCRDCHVTYGAPLQVSFVCWRTGDDSNTALKKTTIVGQVPVMVKSNRCSLGGLSPTEMVKAGEDLDELGGYFIINGNERVLRFVIQQKTNYPIALKRESFRNREVFATDLAILLRSQRFDGTCTSNILLDTEDARCCYRILLNRQEHFCPFLLLLRCVAGGLSLQQLKLKFMEGSWGDIEEATQLHALFEEAWGNEKDFVDTDLIEHRPESMDAFSYQEVVLPGQILASVLKDALFSALMKLRSHFMAEFRQVKAAGHDPKLVISSNKFFDVATDRCASEIGHKMSYFMATGNIRTSQLDLQQVRKLLGESWGFLCPVHTPDGAPCGLLLHLAQMAQPVAVAPDREAIATVRMFMKARGACVDLEGRSGLPPVDLGAAVGQRALGHGCGLSVRCLPLVVDGEVVCKFRSSEFNFWLGRLRHAKAFGSEGFKTHWELVGFDESRQGKAPADIVSSECGCKSLAAAEMKSKNVAENDRAMKAHFPIIEEVLEESSSTADSLLNSEECDESHGSGSSKIGAMQSVQEALVTRNVPLSYDYVELSPTAFLSVTASLTPFSNHNQSPRNIYQCQMLKQTMGTPFHSIPYRHDNKAYRLITPQKPLLRTRDYRHIDFDDYPTGVNAVVAVMCYTGYVTLPFLTTQYDPTSSLCDD